MKKRSGFQVMASLVGLVKPLVGFMVLAVLMGLVGHLCATFITILGGYAVLSVLGEKVPMTLGVLFGTVLLFALLRGVLRYAEQACNHFIAFKLLALIRDKVFQALRRLCPAKLEGKEKGNLIALITSDIELLEVFYAHTISPILIAVLFTIVMCCFIGSFHPLLGLVALVAYSVVGIVIPLITSKANGENGLQFRQKSGALSSFVLDSLRGLPELLQYGQGNQRLEKMDNMTEELSKEEEKMKQISGKNQAVTNTVILFADMAMLFTAVWLFQEQTVALDGVLIPTIALMSSFGPTVALANLGSTLQNTFAAGNRVLDILEETPAVEETTGKQTVSFTGAKVQNVTFSYKQPESIAGKQNTVVLQNVSLTIPKGNIIGIAGKSGCGKSTLLKLLMRFWDVSKGSVTISDKEISELNTTNLRDIESFMTQETHLFHDSIKNNLRIAKLNATDEEIVAACKKASVHEFILSLPQGYDTLVGELGDTLSGGERQRLGLARAFLHDAPFVLLDEPTSNLDSLNEAVILKSLKEESKNKTVLLVSHRESTMRIADKVYTMEQLNYGE